MSWQMKCGLCGKKFSQLSSFEAHAASIHAKNGKVATPVKREPIDTQPTQEWEFMHLSKGWPI
jgi:hypothetical protein